MTHRSPEAEPAPGPTTRVLQAADRVIVRVMWLLRVAAGLVIVAMMLATVYDVVMRYAFARPTEWALTLTSAGVLAATFFAMPHLVAVRGHIEMDLVYRRFGPRVRLLADVVTGLATLAFGACMAWLGYRAALSAYVGGLLTSGNFNIPLWTFYAMVYLGGLGLVLVVVLSPWTPPQQPAAVDDEVPGRASEGVV